MSIHTPDDQKEMEDSLEPEVAAQRNLLTDITTDPTELQFPESDPLFNLISGTDSPAEEHKQEDKD
jgi:hypothetical protein